MTGFGMLLLASAVVSAGGGPANVLVLYNQDAPASLALAQDYAGARSVPDGHLCGVPGVDPLATELSFSDADDTIRQSLLGCLDRLPQPDEIDVLVLCKGLPYRVDLGVGVVSLDALLQVHQMEASGGLLAGQDHQGNIAIVAPDFVGGAWGQGDATLENPSMGYYMATSSLVRAQEWPRGFTRAGAGRYPGWDWSGNLFVVARLDGWTYDDAHALVERGVAADGTFPDAELLCMHGADAARGARDPECEFAVRMLQGAGVDGATWLPDHDPQLSGHTLAAMLTGAASLREGIDGNTYVPGAFVDNITSYGAVPQNWVCEGDTCPANESQTSIARWIRAGATVVHGTVAEPYNAVFPNAGLLLLWTQGYSIGESVLYNQKFLYWMNLVAGDPLTAPWADRPVVQVPDEWPQDGVVQVHASHPHGVAEIRLYVDGVHVADADGDTLSWAVRAQEGDQVQVLAVAVAANAPLEPQGWPVDQVLPQPDVQGWTSIQVQVGPAVDTGDSAVLPPAEPCGCGPGHPAGGWPLVVLAALVGRRRRPRRG